MAFARHPLREHLGCTAVPRVGIVLGVREQPAVLVAGEQDRDLDRPRGGGSTWRRGRARCARAAGDPTRSGEERDPSSDGTPHRTIRQRRPFACQAAGLPLWSSRDGFLLSLAPARRALASALAKL